MLRPTASSDDKTLVDSHGQAAAKVQDETVPLVEVEAERVASERKIAALERQHQQVRLVFTRPGE